MRKRSGRVEVGVMTDAVVAVELLLIDRDIGRSGERSGSGGDAARSGEEVASVEWIASIVKPSGGLAMPTRRERGEFLGGRCKVMMSMASPGYDIVKTCKI